MADYEILGERGMPEYGGMEYDYEVPDDIVAESPGGVSSTHHHWTGGAYGAGVATSDVYGHMAPAHIYGDVGSLYHAGPTATRTVPHGYGADFPPVFGGNQPPPAPPTETPAAAPGLDNIELLEPAREGFEKASQGTGPTLEGLERELVSWKAFVVYLLAFVAFSFWAFTAIEFISQKVHKNRKIPWPTLVMYSFGLTLALMIASWLTGFTGVVTAVI